MAPDNLVVVGASLAGLRAAEAARRDGFTGRITLIGAEPHLPYDRPPLSKAFLASTESGTESATESGAAPVDPTYRTEEALRTELGVELMLGEPATGLDTSARAVLVGDRAVRYDALVIATGAQARALPGTEGLAGVHTLRTRDDAAAIRAALDAGARSLVVVGAGFIGSEVAASARERGLAVTIVESLPTPLVRAVGERMGAACGRLHAAAGTDLRCGVSVRGFRGERRVRQVLLSDGQAVDADLVVVGIGAAPATDWLTGSALTVRDGVLCDHTLWTGVDGVYAAGDVARWHNPFFDRVMRLEHWTSAAEQGAAAARNALNPAAAKPYQTVPYFWSDWYQHRIQFVGVPQADEVEIVDGDLDGGSGRRLVSLYRQGDRLVGALTVNGQAQVMKYRGLIMRGASWRDALDFAEQRRLARVGNSE
jgi:NADPH-dependent 2,4-dienoyl-CoA reductase/sulfur reductase-like enzyme